MSAHDLPGLMEAIRLDHVESAAAQLHELRDLPSFESAIALKSARSPEMADLLVDAGVNLDALGPAWDDGFGLEYVPPSVAEHLSRRGARFTAHAAAALGLEAHLRDLLRRDPSLVRSKGGDGALPLHFSRDPRIATALLEHGSPIDPRDDDHDSTPAQWRIGSAPEVTRFLLDQRATPDLFMAAALNDHELAQRLIEQDPGCLAGRIGNNHGPFPGIGFRGRGGTIYQWTLGFNQSPHEIAHARGHSRMFEFLLERTPPRPRLLIACMMADRIAAQEILARQPDLLEQLDAEDHALLAKSCWETNKNLAAVRLMLDLGFPVAAPEFNHGYQPLHNAAWCGDPELVRLLLERGHPVNDCDPVHHSTPLGFALHSHLHAKRHPEGRFPEVLRLLLAAGARYDREKYPTGDAEIDAVLGEAAI